MGDSWYGDTAGNNVTFYNIPASPSDEEGGGSFQSRHTLMFYNPADLAGVISGTQASWDPQPYLIYDVSRFSFVTNVPNPAPGAICWHTNGYLFFMEPNGEVDWEHGENGLVHAWRVAVTNIPVLTSTLLIEVITADGPLRITCDGLVIDQSYQIQATPALMPSPPPWTATHNFTATGVLHTWSEDLPGIATSRFYRLVRPSLDPCIHASDLC